MIMTMMMMIDHKDNYKDNDDDVPYLHANSFYNNKEK